MVCWFYSYRRNKKTYEISVYSSADSLLIDNLNDSDRLAITKEGSLEAVIEAVTFDKSEIGLVFDDSFVDDLTSNNSAQLTIYSKDIDTFSQAKSIVSNIVDDYEESIRNNRLELLNLDENYVNPITINEEDLTTEEESAGSIFGALLALFFVMYVISGSMYPAIDLGAGEKREEPWKLLFQQTFLLWILLLEKCCPLHLLQF